MTLRLIKNTGTSDVYHGPHYQVPLFSCMHPALNNPYLNAIYKPSITYTERWYLEIRKKILEGSWQHPLVQVICSDSELKKSLVKSAVIDGAYMRNILSNERFPEYHISAGINLKRLNRWCGFFVSLPESVEILVDQCGLDQD